LVEDLDEIDLDNDDDHFEQLLNGTDNASEGKQIGTRKSFTDKVDGEEPVKDVVV